MKTIFQKKSLIFSIIFFILSCLIFISLYKIITDNKKTSFLAEEKWQAEATQRESAKSLVSSINAVESEKNLLEGHFVKSSDVVPFLDTIEKMANDTGIKSEVVSIGVAPDKVSFLVEMNASGSFENIYKLVMLLENSQYDLEFIMANIRSSNIQNTTASNDTKVKEWTASFQIRLLSFIN